MPELELIPDSPEAPSLSRPENFRTEAEPFVMWWQLLPSKINPAIQALSSAAQSASIALQASNYVGNWSDKTGALSQPASVWHNNAFWLLNTDLADVTASEPSDANADWQKYQIDVPTVGTAYLMAYGGMLDG